MTTTETAPEATGAAALSLTLFGPMQVLVQGQPLPHLRSKKALWLLALLTLRHGRPIEREWLAATLWPDSDQDRAFASLRVALSELRQALEDQGERLQSPNRHSLLLDLTGADVDVLTFDAAVAHVAQQPRDLTALERAVSLYRGPLLEGCLEEWAHQERLAREQACLHALQRLAGAATVAAGEAASAIGYWRRAAAIDPLSDGVRRGLMEALAASGDANAALQVYRQFVELLRSDPKASPDERTTALYTRLREQARQRAVASASASTSDGRVSAPPPRATTVPAPVAPVVTGYLPHPLSELVGREDERAEVAALLRHCRLVTLTGTGGIGKTRLAIEVAHEVVSEFPDGVWLVALESLSEGRLVIQQIASVLGLREERGRTTLQTVTDHLAQKRLLLVLDNCEHLLEASANAIDHLLRECGGVHVLATSREVLGITGETVWGVPALTVPEMEHLPEGGATLLRVLMDYESVQLFVERAEAVQKDFALSSSNARTVAQTCQQLEGIPLAIELAAARVRAMSVAQISARLADHLGHLGLLTGGSRPAPSPPQSRQQTLKATLDWSYALLSEAERSLLRRLSVFAGGWTLEAAEQVCRGEGVPEAEAGQVLDLLSSLVDKSLVVFREQDAGGRYRLLEMVRQYAAEGLAASGEAEPVKTRHRDWFLALAEAAEPQLQGVEQASWLQRLETEHDNLRAALARSETDAQGAQAGLRLAGALSRFWFVRGDYNEGRAYVARALAREGAQEATALRANALNMAGILAFNQADYVSSSALLEEAMSIHRSLGDKQGIALSLNDMGAVAFRRGDYRVARTLSEESLAIRRELGDKQGIAQSLHNLESAARAQGDYEAARTLLEESLAIRRELGDQWNITYSLYNLGNVAYPQGDYEVARTLLQECLALCRETGHPHTIHVLGLLGHVERDAGDDAQATALYRESLLLRQEQGDVLATAQSLEDLASLAGRQGQCERAVRLLGSAETLAATLGRTLPVAVESEYERTVAAARAALGEQAFAAAWANGRAMALEAAVAFALGDMD